MACKYRYGNILFDSELELDDFIISKGQELVDLIGDVAYSRRTNAQLGIVKSVEKLKAQSDINKKELRNKDVDSFNYMFGEYKNVDNKYKPITKFLQGLTNVDGSLLFPEMIKDNFFAERTKYWVQGKFTPRELETLEGAMQLKRNGNNEILPPDHIDTETLKEIRSIMEDKWDAEAKIGSAIHKVCQTFFSKFHKSDTEHFDPNNPDRIKGMILQPKTLLQEIKNWSKFGNNQDVQNLLTEAQQLQVIEFCTNLVRSIMDMWPAHSKTKAGVSDYLFYPELTVKAAAKNPATGEDTNLIGVIDLLVIDPNGVPHIIDYKVSPADYYKQSTKESRIVDPDEYSAAKVLGFEYQLSTYARMLRTISGNFRRTSIAVAPIQVAGLKWDEKKKGKNKWTFERIITDKPPLETLLDKEDQIGLKNKVDYNLDQIFEDGNLIDVDAANLLTNTKTVMEGFFPGFNKGNGYTKAKAYYTDIEIAEMIKDKITKTADEQNYIVEHNGQLYQAKTEKELIREILNDTNRKIDYTKDLVLNFKDQITGQREAFISTKVENDGGDAGWYKEMVANYSKDVYAVVDTPEAFDYLGIVLLENLLTNSIEIVKLTPYKLKELIHLGKNKKLTGSYMEDIEDESNKNYVLEARWGNFEIMETLAAIVQTPTLFANKKISNIQVINPYSNSGLTATNKQILYTWKKLSDFSPIPQSVGVDYIRSNQIKFATLAEQAFDIIYTGYRTSSEQRRLLFNSCFPNIEELLSLSPDTHEKTLRKIIDVMESGEEQQNSLRAIKRYMDIEKLPINKDIGNIQYWYRAALRGYAEAKGYDYVQQVDEYSNYVDSYNPEKGHSGLLLDNPGTTANQNANMVSEYMENCYSRVATRLKGPTAQLQKIIRKLKDERGRSWIKDKVTLNPLSIYNGMIKRVQVTNNHTGNVWEDLVFENPNNLSGVQKELAEFALLTINYNRFNKGESIEEFKKTMDQQLNKKIVDLKWLRVPLGYMGSQAVLETNGLIKGLSDYIKSWKLKEVKRRVKEEFGHLYEENGQESNKEIFRMKLIFDKGESLESREQMLKDPKTGKDMAAEYDQDIERLVLKHLYSYILKDEFNEASYMMKAAIIDQRTSEATQNAGRVNSIDYISKLIKRMSGKKLMSQKEQIINSYVKKFMKGASVMALGFSPKQMYQSLEGIYKDIGLLIRKPDGTYGFTFSEMLAAFADVWKEIGHFGLKRSKLERMNELFRLNDMDMNVYAEHLQDRHNIWHDMSTFLFRFASRPDFYNRLTIIEAYMRHDGVWDAYSVNDNNELIYDFYKDPRFSTLHSSNPNINDPEYQQQLGLYTAMAEQFEKEGAYNQNGTKFVQGKTDGKWNPLPQAYTNKEMNSFKALTDQMYGYYSQEKKALIQSSLIGSMFFQMYTYFSGKKNQWLAPGSVKNQGRMLHYEDYVIKEKVDAQGNRTTERVKEKFYYQVDENGNVLFDQPPVPESQLQGNIKVPFYQWKGTFTQGVVTTISRMLGDIVRSDFSEQSATSVIKDVYDNYWNNIDENLRTAYRQNLRQFSYEMFVFLAIGGILGSQVHRFINNYTGDHKDDHSVIQGFKNTAASLFDTIFSASTLDFNVFDSLGGRGLSWTPFSIDMWKRTVQNWSKVITGDRRIFDAVLKTFSASKYGVVPFLDTIKNTESREVFTDDNIRQAA